MKERRLQASLVLQKCLSIIGCVKAFPDTYFVASLKNVATRTPAIANWITEPEIQKF